MEAETKKKERKHTLIERLGIAQDVVFDPDPQEYLRGFFDKYIVIGFDFGDGEISAARVNKEGDTLGKRRLNLDPDGDGKYRAVNMIRFDGERATFVQKTDDNNKIYYNYKRHPDKSEATYPSDGLRYTYRELMAHGFPAIVKAVLRYSGTVTKEEGPKGEETLLLPDGKELLLLVGRPSGAKWEEAETKYTEILKENLGDYLPNCTIHLAVQSESAAALAAVLSKEEDRNRVFVVIDCGSSTFDYIIITPQGVEGEGCFPFGGGTLDECMLKYMRLKCREKYPDTEFKEPVNIKLDIRKELKEGYFSKYPDSVKVYVLRSEDDSKRFKYIIDEDSMDIILYNRDNLDELEILSSEDGGLENYHSWMDACEGIFRHIKTRTDKIRADGYSEEPVVVLTGGVANMQPVQKLAEEVFGTKPRMEEEPTYTVCYGLAYIAGIEIRKHYLLQLLLQDLDSLMPGGEALRSALIKASADVDYTAICKSSEAWFDRSSASIRDYLDIFETNWDKTAGFAETAVGILFEQSKIGEKLPETLKSRLDELFPGYTETFDYRRLRPDYAQMFQESLASVGENEKKKAAVLVTAFHPYLYFDEDNLELYDGNPATRYTKEQLQKMKTVFDACHEKLLHGWSTGYEAWDFAGLPAFYDQAFPADKVEEFREKLKGELEKAVADFVEEITFYYKPEEQSAG